MFFLGNCKKRRIVLELGTRGSHYLYGRGNIKIKFPTVMATAETSCKWTFNKFTWTAYNTDAKIIKKTYNKFWSGLMTEPWYINNTEPINPIITPDICFESILCLWVLKYSAISITYSVLPLAVVPIKTITLGGNEDIWNSEEKFIRYILKVIKFFMDFEPFFYCGGKFN